MFSKTSEKSQNIRKAEQKKQWPPKQWQALIESHFETKRNIRKIILDQSW